MIAIIIMFILVYDQVKKKPVYRDSPADPNYINYMVTTSFLFNEVKGLAPEKTYTIEKIFYVYNQLKSEEIMDYIAEHAHELYFKELNNIELKYRDKYDSIPTIKSKTVKIDMI